MDSVAFPILVIAFILLATLEFFIILRRWVKSRWVRWFHNGMLAIIGLPAARLLLLPATVSLAYWCGENNLGLLNMVQFPAWLKWILGLLILDYAIYLWHRLNHIFPFLWRFHNVHHADTEMDISTGLRFHVGEMLFSIPFRLMVIFLSGVSPIMLLVYEVVFESATLFHHSNIRLPVRFENLLVKLIVTPRMHGVHHSIVQKESNSNYSTVLNWWDRLHRTAVLNVRQEDITIGVPGYRKKEDNTFWRLLILPFTRQRPWKLPDGTVPKRREEEKSRVLE